MREGLGFAFSEILDAGDCVFDSEVGGKGAIEEIHDASGNSLRASVLCQNDDR